MEKINEKEQKNVNGGFLWPLGKEKEKTQNEKSSENAKNRN